MPDPSPKAESDDGPRWPLLIAIVSLALALRLLWWRVGAQVIESEGIYYARVGENLASGRGLVGIHEMGLQLLYPPLYEALIAAGVKLGFNSETAGRGVSLLFGTLMPIVAMALGRRLYGMNVGRLIGLLFAVHPLLIALSVAVLTESTYLTLSLAAIYWIVELLDLKSPKAAVLGGVALGLAYLCRPEGLVLAAVMAILAVSANSGRMRLAAKRAALLGLVVAIFALPYVAFLYHETGQFRFEAKTADATRYELANETGTPIGAIYFAVDKNLVESGNSNTPDLQQLLTTRISFGHRVRILAKQTVKNFPHLLRALAGTQLGQPILGLLIALGVFAVSWDPVRARKELPLLGAIGLTLLTFGNWPFFHDRFLFPLLPPLLVWSGLGLERLRLWVTDTGNQLALRTRTVAMASAAAMVFATFLLCVGAAVGVRTSDELSLAWSPLKDEVPVGLWLRTHVGSERFRVMDTIPTVAYYAGAVLVTFPWTDAETALRYINHKQVSYVILRDGDDERRPYYKDWLQRVPEQLELLAGFPTMLGQTRIYRWNGGRNAPE